MKRSFLYLFLATCLFGCNEKVTPETTASQLLGTWLVVEEVRGTDLWTQADKNGVITDWKIINPFSVGFSVSSVQFNKDQMFYWNVDQIDDWDHFIELRNTLPANRWPNYTIDNHTNEITLYTPFEYVGIIKVDTTKFQVLIVDANNLILKNNEVQLKFDRIN